MFAAAAEEAVNIRLLTCGCRRIHMLSGLAALSVRRTKICTVIKSCLTFRLGHLVAGLLLLLIALGKPI